MKVIYAFAFALFASVMVSAQSTVPTYQDTEAYEIYATLLPHQWAVTEAHTRTMIIRAETSSSEMCLKPEGESIAMLEPVIKNFIEINKQAWLLEKAIPMDVPYEFVFDKELDAIFASGAEGWKNFYEKYPDSGGYNEVSAVGFNKDKTVAVVYVAHMCGGLCGGGSFHVLEKKDGKWQTLKWKGTECSWVS
jgi:hypothetical protein